ncbi:MAG: hypothetical protein ACI841_001957 [Planctomycetota bacterium]|jgi:hypothetical protein
MKKHPSLHGTGRPESGAALLLSMLVLIVIGMIVYQINNVTLRDLAVSNTDVTLTQMDLAIESTLLEVAENLMDDAAAAGAEDGASGDAASAMEGGEGEGGGGGGAVDSKMDSWATAQSTNIGDLTLRILIQDEDSKYNILNMLVEDEDEAEAALERVARVIDNFREGTEEDVDTATAEEMARVMRDHMRERSDSYLPRGRLLTDNDEDEAIGMPLTLREFVVLEPFEERHFRDYFDLSDVRVHGLSSFLTIYTSPGFATGEDEEAIAATGFGVNVNTAPLAVLNALFDEREVDTRFWDAVLEYRNEAEEVDPTEEVDPMLDEFQNEILQRKFFDDLEELSEVYEWDVFEPEAKAEVEEILQVESNVFSVYITARVSTRLEANQILEFRSRDEKELYERSGTHIVRTVRAVLWRAPGEDGPTIVPLVRWEVLDYAPLEVLDYADDERW